MRQTKLWIGIWALLVTACGSVDSEPNDADVDSSQSTVAVSDPMEEVKEKRFFAFAKEREGKYGFEDASGELLIDYQFDCASSFAEGYARVGRGECEFGSLKAGKYGFIDRTGNLVVDYLWDNAANFSEGLAPVAEGEYDKYGIFTKGSWGYINPKGKLVIELQFDHAQGFSNGFAKVRKGNILRGKVGFIDKSGELAIGYQYDDADHFLGGFAPVNKRGKWGFIDTTGTVVLPLEYENYMEIIVFFGEGGNSYFTQEGYAIVSKKKKWDYVSREDNQALSGFRYDDVDLFSEGLAAVKKGKMWGYMNEKGEEVIEPQFAEAGKFLDGRARVENKAGHAFFISPEGDCVEDCPD